jgi:hypothetical protein
MSWSMGKEYTEYVEPSLVLYVSNKAKERGTDPHHEAVNLFIDQRHHHDDFDEESWRDKLGYLTHIIVCRLTAEFIDTMTNGAHAFSIDKGGWTNVPVCTEEFMMQYWA